MRRYLCVWLAAVLLLCCGCSAPAAAPQEEVLPPSQETPAEETNPPAAQEEVPEPEPPASEEAAAVRHVVVLDPGHQDQGNYDTEPNGPGSSVEKAKVSSGTQGQFTGLAEYELNLQIGLQLREELEARGYTVYLTRETNDVDLSNVERAQYAASVGGEILVRLHANGSENPATSGALMVCQSPDNPYQEQYTLSRLLSDCILETYCPRTGIADQGVWETDTMTGLNWCEIPSTIVEMGYMTNESDDTNMADPEFQKRMVQGIADGIDLYFTRCADPA